LQPGRVNDDLVSAIDVTATMLEIAGLGTPTHMQGRRLLGSGPVKREYVFAARDRCDGTADRIRCVRSDRYKCIRNYMPERPYTQFNAYKTGQYPVLALLHVLHEQGKLTPVQARFMAPRKPEEELYDLMADPHETVNLATDPANQLARHTLRTTLDEWIRSTGDQGATPEDRSVRDRAAAAMQKAHRHRMQRIGLPPDASPQQLLAYWERRLLKR